MKRRSGIVRSVVPAGLGVIALVLLGTPALAQNQAPPPDGAPAQPPEEHPAESPAPAPGAEASKATPSSVDPAIRGMFEQAGQRLKEARTLSFHAKVAHSGTLAGKSPAGEADVKMLRGEIPTAPWRYRSTGSGGRDPAAPTAFDATWDRQTISWLDKEARKLVQRPGHGVKPVIVQTAMAPVPTQFQEVAPFSREMGAESMTLETTESVGGVSCDVIAVQYRLRTGVTKFWLAESDRLPRKIERVSESTKYPNSTVYEFTNVKIDEPMSEDQVTIALPDGFTLDASVTPTPPPRPAGTATGGESHAAPAPSPTVDQSAPAPAPAKEEFPGAPRFELAGADGAKVSLASFKGSVVVLYFWGTWSLPSRGADPEVQALYDKFKDRGVKLLGMSVREKNFDAPAEFLRSQGRTYANLPNADAVAHLYSVVRYPTFVVIDAEGRLRRTVEGFKADSTLDEVRAAVDKALGSDEGGGS